jgi:hypothetical protein
MRVGEIALSDIDTLDESKQQEMGISHLASGDELDPYVFP